MTSLNSTNKSLKNDIAFVGLTHLGLVFSICTSSLKKKVLALDEDNRLISRLSKGVVDIPEPGLQTILLKHRHRINFSVNFRLLSNTPLIFISLDTPTDKPFNLKNLNLLIEKVISFLADGSILVITSQVPVGFTRKLKEKIEIKKPNLNFKLYYFLNTLIIGDSVNRFLKSDRIIVGLDLTSDQIAPSLQSFLDQFNCPIIKMSYESAELTKSAINLYLASSIITSNTLSDFCEKLGADISEIIPALKSDKRIGPYAYLKPTLRISGGHLERELIKLKTLSNQHNIPAGIIDPLIKLNNNRLNWLYQKINQLSTKSNPIKTITLWGLSYKKDSESTYNASSVEIIKRLSGRFNFQIYDPIANLAKNLPPYKRFKNKYSALNNSDLLIILTDWDEFQYVDYNKAIKLLNNPFIIDCTGIIKNDLPVIRMGFGQSFQLP